jgi:hypothetical protein
VRRSGFGARVQALLEQLLTQPNDHLLGVGVDGVRAVMRPPRPRPENNRAFALIPLHKLLHPIPGDPVVAGHIGFRSAFGNHSGDDQLSPGHGARPDKVV